MSRRSASVLDRYVRAMTDSSEYEDTDFPFTTEIQRALYAHQNPSSCESSSFLIYYVWSHGFGAVTRGMTTALAMAASTDRILLLAAGPVPSYKNRSSPGQIWTTWRHAVGCKTEHPECFFLPVSSCNLTRVHEQMEREEMSYVELDDDATADSVPNAGEGHPRVVVARGKMSWLMPFRKMLRVGVALEKVGVSEDVRNNSWFGEDSSTYTKTRLWHMQAALYVLRLNEVSRVLLRGVGIVSLGGSGVANFALTVSTLNCF
jgi:hypothetical protein